jgi:ubiquitin-conjugating enzyme E2 Q
MEVANFNSTMNPPPSPELEQDPKHTATTTLGKAVGVPQCAITVSRAFRVSNASDNASLKGPPAPKRSKHSTSGSKLSLMETAMSDEEEMEDLIFLFSDGEEPPGKGKGKETEVVVLS